MGKLTVEQAQKISRDVSSGLGAIGNDSFDALSEDTSGAALKELIARARAKIAQYDDALTKLGDVHAKQFTEQYERKVSRLRDNIPKLEAKLKSK